MNGHTFCMDIIYNQPMYVINNNILSIVLSVKTVVRLTENRCVFPLIRVSLDELICECFLPKMKEYFNYTYVSLYE